MKIEQRVYGARTGWEIWAGNLSSAQPHLVPVFGGRDLVEQNQGLDELRETCPTARIISASTSDAIVNTDETAQCMVFAGDIPMGACERFMHPSYEDIIDGAGQAAEQGRGDADPELVICVSCVGRRWVLGQRTEEETESVRAAVGSSAVLTGFYSYGELAPTGIFAGCRLHNQTMSVTSLREV
jgi:FIST C domain